MKTITIRIRNLIVRLIIRLDKAEERTSKPEHKSEYPFVAKRIKDGPYKREVKRLGGERRWKYV